MLGRAPGKTAQTDSRDMRAARRRRPVAGQRMTLKDDKMMGLEREGYPGMAQDKGERLRRQLPEIGHEESRELYGGCGAWGVGWGDKDLLKEGNAEATPTVGTVLRDLWAEKRCCGPCSVLHCKLSGLNGAATTGSDQPMPGKPWELVRASFPVYSQPGKGEEGSRDIRKGRGDCWHRLSSPLQLQVRLAS